MIPIELTLQGIFSYQEKQSINFKNLLADQIFGIFGKVGSGKSSILDAITFALYGQIEKMNKQDSINYNLMNLKSDHMLIDFSFLDDENQAYRFVVSAKRNKKRFEEVKSLEKTQYKKINGEWQAGDYNAEEIIGLSYDNFKRTIIIPQGKFMEFLQLKDTERTNMLKEIFELNKFDLWHRISSLNTGNNSQLDNLAGQLEQFDATNTTEIDKQKELLKTIEKEKKDVKAIFDKKDKAFNELENIKTVFEELNLAQDSYQKLNSQKESFINKDKQIKAYELCLSNIKPLIDKRKTSLDKREQLSKTLETQKIEVEEITKQIKENVLLFEESEKEFNNIENYKHRVDEMDKIISTNKLKHDLQKIEQTIIIETANNKNQTIQETQLKQKISNLKIEITELEKNETDISELSEIREWFIKKDNFDNEIKTLSQNLVTKEQSIQKLTKQKESIIPEQKQEKLNIDFSKSITEIIELLNSKITDFENKLSQAKIKRDELIIKQELKKFSENLKSGKSCPVCGSKEHPDPINIKGIEIEISKLKAQTKNGEKYIADLRDYISDFRILEAETNLANENAKESKTQLNRKETDLKTFIKSFNWKAYTINDNEKVISDFKNLEKVNKSIKDKRKQSDLETDKLSVLTDKISESKEKITKLGLSEKAYNVQINTLLEQVKLIDLKIFVDKSLSELTSEQNNTSSKIKKIESTYERLEKKLKDLNLNLAKTTSTITGLNLQLTEIDSDLVIINSQINDKLKAFNYSSIQDVEDILKKNFDIEKEKQDIKNFELQLNTIQTTLNNLKKQTIGKSFDQITYQKIKTEISELSIKIEKINNNIGAYQNIIQKLSKDLKQKESLEKQLKLKEQRKENIKVLLKLFKAQGFVKFVSSVYMKQLIEYANKRFHKLTKQSLSLVLNEKNGFDVVDYLNNGRTRSVKTLSGGQMFQASLSLALALAGSVQKQNKSDKNFFFLDEGFGTQDEESLQLVFDTIKSLRKENRVVGIISHVDDLQNEISTYLSVHKDDERGSLIQTSW